MAKQAYTDAVPLLNGKKPNPADSLIILYWLQREWHGPKRSIADEANVLTRGFRQSEVTKPIQKDTFAFSRNVWMDFYLLFRVKMAS
eukprot:scaffold286_cov169-Amphora_coffeaeformis.AAC.13